MSVCTGELAEWDDRLGHTLCGDDQFSLAAGCTPDLRQSGSCGSQRRQCSAGYGKFGRQVRLSRNSVDVGYPQRISLRNVDSHGAR
jgi:hypothetical protein